MNTQVMTDNQAAQYLGVTKGTLANWRYENKGPRFHKPTAKLVYYMKDDLDAWIKSEPN